MIKKKCNKKSTEIRLSIAVLQDHRRRKLINLKLYLRYTSSADGKPFRQTSQDPPAIFKSRFLPFLSFLAFSLSFKS